MWCVCGVCAECVRECGVWSVCVSVECGVCVSECLRVVVNDREEGEVWVC